jgi:hypothetical protein
MDSWIHLNFWTLEHGVLLDFRPRVPFPAVWLGLVRLQLDRLVHDLVDTSVKD